MKQFDQLLNDNQTYAADFKQGGLPLPPARKVAVLTCMDARFHPEQALGIKLGEAHVIRNAGGRAADALRSLVISEQLLGTTEIVVLHHTDCGMLTFTNQDLVQIVEKELNQNVGGQDFLPFADLEQSVRDDVNFLSKSPLIPKHIAISGGVYDVHTGKVTEIIRV